MKQTEVIVQSLLLLGYSVKKNIVNDVMRNITAPIKRRYCNGAGSLVLYFTMFMLNAANVPGRAALFIGSTRSLGELTLNPPVFKTRIHI